MTGVADPGPSSRRLRRPESAESGAARGTTIATVKIEPLDLGTRLRLSSSRFATSALGAMSEAEHDVFLLHAATALEHLAKAVLASRHPSFIAVADKDNFDSLYAVLLGRDA